MILDNGPAVTLDDELVRKLHNFAFTKHDKLTSSIVELLIAMQVISRDEMEAMISSSSENVIDAANNSDWSLSISSDDVGNSPAITHEQRKRSGI